MLGAHVYPPLHGYCRDLVTICPEKIAGLAWESFTALLCTWFGRDNYQTLVRQFYAIKQVTTVADFIEHFEVLMYHLICYSEDTHPYFFLTRFVEGLRPDIHAVVLV